MLSNENQLGMSKVQVETRPDLRSASSETLKPNKTNRSVFQNYTFDQNKKLKSG